MNILVTGANGQLGNEIRLISKGSSDRYIFTDVNRAEGQETFGISVPYWTNSLKKCINNLKNQ